METNLKINDAAPMPAINETEVLVQVHAMALNPVDYKVTEAPLTLRLLGSNLTPGSDFCGKVAGVGSKVEDFQVGDWVFGAKPGELKNGTLAQYAAVTKEMVAKLPDGVKAEEAAGATSVGLTGYQAIAPNVKNGDNIFINGGSGGTGVFSIQIAKALGCHVTTTCSTANVDLCKSLGADQVIDYKIEDVVKTLAGGSRKFNLVVDNIGTPANLYTASSTFLLPSGKFVQIGASPNVGGVMQLGTNMLLPNFLGGGKSSYQMMFGKASNSDLNQLGEWMREGKVKGVVDSVWEWEDAPKAYEKLKTGRAKGKIVVKVPQDGS